MFVSPFLISANLLYIPSSPPKSNLPEDELDCKSLCSFFTYCVAFCVFACTSTTIVDFPDMSNLWVKKEIS